jgi:outer membrane protein OmpA-like peptidoglycan-associated protein
MILLALPIITGLHAATVTVGTGSGYDFASIQDAIDDASDGDVISVAAGTYRESIVLGGKDVTIQSSGSTSRTIISPSGSAPAITVDQGERAALIEGFTITPSGGRAIWVSDASPSFMDLVIESSGTPASGQGGAVYVSGGSPSFDQLEIVNSKAAYGGDFFITDAADVLISDASLSSAQATYGGSLWVENASVTLISVEADSPRGTHSGGFALLENAELNATNLEVNAPSVDAGYGAGLFAWDHSVIVWDGGGISGAVADEYRSGYTGGAIHLQGASSLEATSLEISDNMAYAGGGMDLQGSSWASLDRCTFDGNEAYTKGGGLRSYNSASVSCTSCVFEGNSAEEGGAVDVSVDASYADLDGSYEDNQAYGGDGGAIRVADQAELSLEGSTFEGNWAQESGGALAIEDPGDEDVVLLDTSFTSNEADSGDGGAIVVSSDANLWLGGSSFDLNLARLGWGGAVAFDPGGVGYVFEAADCSFEENTADDGGGAIWVYEADEATITDSSFLRNVSYGDGGGLYLEANDEAYVSRNLFHENAAAGAGGASYETATTYSSTFANNIVSENLANVGAGLALEDLDIQPEVTNNNLTGNDASAQGAHLYLAGATVSFVNNIAALGVDGGGLYADDSASATSSDFYYCDVWSNAGGDYTGTLVDPVGTSGNISEDPLLAAYSQDGDETNDDHHLQLSSPCLDAGDPSIVDLDGTRSDIGVYGGPEADGTDADSDGYWDITDCDDTDPSINPGAEEVPYDGVDQDCDGLDLEDVDGDGWTAPDVGGTDCDDEDESVYPGAPDTWYDGVDSDCAGDDDFDQDGDGFQASGYGGQDCDDTDGNIFPGAPDTWYDGVDSDCEGNSDYDADGDGRDDVGYGGDDCDDTDASIFPGAPEIPYDGLDQDCDGEDITDVDQDGYDAEVVGGDDCDDNDANSYPGAPDSPYDGVDSDCDGFSDFDKDHDGHDSFVAPGGTDCDDGDPDINPDAAETWYDGVDQDCDGHSDYDQDYDGWDSDEHGGEDCDDTHADAHPGAEEQWYDGIDQGCDGGDDYDQDGDGWRWEAFDSDTDDCDDENAQIHPGAVELPDGLDNDCDGYTELDDRDEDGLSDWVEWTIGTDYENPDSDGDTLLDGEEAVDPLEPYDTDADLIIDPLDEDDDDDGIPSLLELTTDIDDDEVWDRDVDDDGLLNSVDEDADGDGYPDAREGTHDRDRDGVPDYLDYTGDYAGGGCAALGGCGGGNGGLAGLLLLGGLVGRRRKRLPSIWAPLAGLALLLAALLPSAEVLAQDYDRMDVRGFWLADSSGDPHRPLRLAYPSSGTGWDAGLLVDAASRPLVEILPEGREPIVDLMTSAHAFGGISWRGMRFDLAVPVTLYGHDLQGGFAAMGDLRAGMHVPAVAPRGRRPGVGVAAYGWVPTGGEARWSGSPGFAAGAVATLAQELGPIGWTANAGLRVARADDTRNVRSGPGPIGGLDVHYSLSDTLAVGLGAVVQGTTGFASLPLEADARIRYRVRGGGFALAGVATGLTDGVGASGARAYAGVGYGRRRSDWSPAVIEAPAPTIIHNVTVTPGSLDLGEQPLAFLAEDRIVLREQIFFREARTSILADSEEVLRAVRDVLKEHPELTHLLVEGHTNSRGSESYNLELSEGRAQAVVDWLVRNGVEGDRLLAKGRGESSPLLDDSDPDAMVVNRRVEFIVLRADETADDLQVPEKDAIPDEAWKDR